MTRAKAFTLVEILIVVVLLGVLAAIVIPAFGNGATSARQSTLSQELRILQRVVLIYKAQHLEAAPGYPNGQTSVNPTEQTFLDQVLLSSDTSGQTAALGTAGYNRGPYLAKIPMNPINGKNTIQMLNNAQAFPADADNSHGWIYKAATGEMRPDCTGVDESGNSFYDY
jgi:general secretion pathway protein G